MKQDQHTRAMNHDVGKVIAGALLDAIHQHGPIDKQNVAGAEKRVRRSLSGSKLLRDPGEPTENLIARLRSESVDDADYVSKLERHVMEGLRVNVGVMVENAELKREMREREGARPENPDEAP